MTKESSVSSDFATRSVVVERVARDDAQLHALSVLRRTVFRGWPYLYDGDADYERSYLAEFLNSDAAVLIVARVGEIAVGMATASPLSSQPAHLQDPFLLAGFEIEDVFYFGESVLLPQFRGLGIGHRFFDEREKAAKIAGMSTSAFCAVVRSEHHPARPVDARDLSSFWGKRGYSENPQLQAELIWKEVGQMHETRHQMSFWTRRLP
ncbi:MAG: GNAT family N-acetyltransferase [Sphingobium sp.]|nr:GNAT family N-acetyltransferase [Sphingobium sp.]